MASLEFIDRPVLKKKPTTDFEEAQAEVLGEGKEQSLGPVGIAFWSIMFALVCSVAGHMLVLLYRMFS